MKTTQSSHIVKVDKSAGREEPEMRQIRSQLRLSANWIVESKEVVRRLQDYSDEYPDSLDDHPDGPEGWRGDPFLGDCTIHIRYRKRRKYLCPHCGCQCRPHEYVKRTLMHIPDLGYRTKLVVTLPKLHCGHCGRYPRVRFPMARDRVSYTKEFEKSVLRSLTNDTIVATAKAMAWDSGSYPTYWNIGSDMHCRSRTCRILLWWPWMRPRDVRDMST